MRDTSLHVIFDWNGTLLDDVPACVQALNCMLKRRRLPPVTEQQYRDQFGFPVMSFYRRLGFDFESEDWDKAAVEFHQLYRRHVGGCKLRDGAADLLARLQKFGIGASVLSASETSFLESELSRCGLRSFFARVSGISNIYADSKLSSAKQLAGEIALPPRCIILLGDTTHDAEVARTVGFRCVLLTGGHQSAERLSRCGCPLMSDLRGFWSFIRNDEAIDCNGCVTLPGPTDGPAVRQGKQKREQ